MSNFFNKLKNGLAKTRMGLVDSISRVIGKQVLNDSLIDEIEEILLLSDVGVQVAEYLMDRLKQQVRENGAPDAKAVLALLKKEMVQILTQDSPPDSGFDLNRSRPFVISVVGVNGTGKTTTIGKLANNLKQDGKSVLLAAADTFRAAASEQLIIWSQRAGVELVRNNPGADPASVAYDSLQAAIARKIDVLIVDTAGRLHTKFNLMEELKKIHRVLDKALPGAPHEVLLVMDATTGQNGLSQARQFIEVVNVSGLVLTKLDGTAKGGIIFSICQNLKIPVRFIGLGERLDDLQPFQAADFVEALFG